MMPNDRQDRGGPGASEHARFAGLWNDSWMHHDEICPPEPAHQRALKLLPMDDDGLQGAGSACSSRDKKHCQRTTGKKRQCVEEEASPRMGNADTGRAHGSATGSERGREYKGGVNKKMRKMSKRMVQNNDDITIFPRRKAGQDKLGSNRPPIVISRTVLESYFNMPQQKVCEKLVSFCAGVCCVVYTSMLWRHHSFCIPAFPTDGKLFSSPQGICATVIKKVCRQLGIDKWPFKGNKITLRKQGVCHGRKKAERNETPEKQAPSSDSSDAHSQSPALPRPAPSVPYQRSPSHSGHSHMMEQRGMRTAPAQPSSFRQMPPSSDQKPAAARAVAQHCYEEPMQPRRAGLPLEFRLHAPVGARGVGASSSMHASFMERSMVEMERWRMGGGGHNMGGGPDGVFGWESRALLPGGNRSPHHHHHTHAARSAPRCMSPGALDGAAARSSFGSAVAADMEIFRFEGGGESQSKFSPQSDADVKKETSAGLDDDDQGFDLSWLVPSDQVRALPDMDADLLERFRTPFQYAEN